MNWVSAEMTLTDTTVAENVPSGGIWNHDGATLLLIGSTVSQHTNAGAGSGAGGIYNVAGSVTLINSTVSGNTTTSGGGIFNDGGGTVTLPENRALIQSSGVSVWLDPPLPTMLGRLSAEGANRPLFEKADQAASLYRERLPVYERSDIRVRVEPEEGPERVTMRIVRRLEGLPCVS